MASLLDYSEGLSLVNKFMEDRSRELVFGKEKDMNITEKTLVKSFMGIEHGPGASEEDLILASGYFHAVEREIKLQGNTVPRKFQQAIDAVDRDLGIKQQDSKQRKLQELREERDSLLSKEEKRKVVEAEIARLEEELKK